VNNVGGHVCPKSEGEHDKTKQITPRTSNLSWNPPNLFIDIPIVAEVGGSFNEFIVGFKRPEPYSCCSTFYLKIDFKFVKYGNLQK
jgi:hypothetical protein